MKEHGYKAPFVRKVAFYSQKVLPLVFDNSLSYLESLAHFCHKLNEIIIALNNQTLQITEFEKELALALDLFEKEIRERQDTFEQEMKDAFDAFKAEILAEWNAVKAEWAEMKTDWTEFQTEIRQIQEDFEAEITAQQTAFETAQTQRQQAFETAETAARTAFESAQTQRQQTFENSQTQRQQTFENAQTQRQQNFENSETAARNAFETAITTQQDNFETEVENRLDGFSSIDYCSYFGAFDPSQTDPPTIPTIASSPLSGADLIVRVYYKSAESSTFVFLKRMRYDDLMTDPSIPAWTASNQAFWIIFENPVVWEWIKSGITPYGEAARNFSSDRPRLQIRSFNEISNDKISLTNSILLGSYNLPAGVIDTPYQMTTIEEPMTAHAPYTFCGFGFYAGLKSGSIQTITQPTGSTTRVKPSYIYDGFSGGILRDPKITEIESKYNSAYIYQIAGGTSTKTITLEPSAAYVVFLTFGSWCNVYFLNSTTIRAYIKTVVDQMNADITATYTDLSVTFTSTAGNAFTLFAKRIST